MVLLAEPYSPNWKWIFFWPAGNLFVAGLFYVTNNATCFGKKENGTLKLFNALFFLPYLTALWCVWFLFAKSAKENPFDFAYSDIWLGRRLDQSEAKNTKFDNIIDLTAEFMEPAEFRTRNYVPFFMLDGAVPPMDDLRGLARKVCQFPGKSLIHCAQGHGRTGLVAVAILLELEPELSVEEALAKLRSCRPGIHCNKRQTRYLRELADRCRQDG